jgi:hemerythrin
MSVGVETLDEQHKDLVLLIDAAYLAVMDESGESDRDAAESLIRDMKSYAVDHFALEESHMRRLGYASLAEHAFMHKEFLRRVAELERPATELDKKVDVFLFLADWLRTHILREDLDFGDYARSLARASKSSK